MTTVTRITSGIAALTFGALGGALGFAMSPASPDQTSQVLAQSDRILTDSEVIGDTGRPITEQPIKLPGRPVIGEEVPPIKLPPIREPRLRANEGVGNGVDGNTPGHLHNGGNDDPEFSPGNPGGRNK